PRGRALLEDAARDGALVVLEDLDFRDLDGVQPHQVYKKQAVAARLDAMRDAGALIPSFSGLRLDDAAATTDAETLRANYRGMRERLDADDNREPSPADGGGARYCFRVGLCRCGATPWPGARRHTLRR